MVKWVIKRGEKYLNADWEYSTNAEDVLFFNSYDDAADNRNLGWGESIEKVNVTIKETKMNEDENKMVVFYNGVNCYAVPKKFEERFLAEHEWVAEGLESSYWREEVDNYCVSLFSNIDWDNC